MSDRRQAADGDNQIRSSTGVEGLDDILSGGLPTSHVFLVEGEPGTGKTTLGLQFLLDGLRNRQRVLYITLSESEREIRKVATSHGWTLEGVSIFEFPGQEDGLRPEEQYSAFHPSEIELLDTTQHILEQVEQKQPHRVVFDSLSEVRLLARDPLRYRRQVLALKHYFANRNCTVMLLDDLTGSPEDHQLRSIAHGVLVMEMLPRDFGIIRRRLRVAKLRGSVFREGYHDYTIETGGLRVFPRLLSSEHRTEYMASVLPSGNPELDALWGGGIDRGSSTLLIGPAGVGKSSLTMMYATAAAVRGDRVHIFIFDEAINAAIHRATKLGLDTAKLSADGKIKFEQVNPAAVSPGELIQRIRYRVETQGTRMIVLDSINGLLAAMPGESHLVLHMHELLRYLNHYGVTTLLVLGQSGILGTGMLSSVDLSYLADNMLLLRYFEAGGQVRKAVSIVKKRGGAHEQTIRELSFEGSRISVGRPLVEFHGILTGVPSYTGSMSGLEEGPDGNPQP